MNILSHSSFGNSQLVFLINIQGLQQTKKAWSKEIDLRELFDIGLS
jgi:hypothetical protein